MDARRPQRQDTFDLRGQLITDDDGLVVQGHNDASYPSDEEHSVLEDDSDTDDRDGDYAEEDDRSSTLSIPSESIDFDLVYSLHTFAATVEGQASVVKGDSLTLMDDSNSYWWLVRVLKTQEIGYIPAENIETPFERLARLNKHRNIDLAQPNQIEKQNGLQESREHFRNNMSSRTGTHANTPSPPTASTAPAARARRSTKGVVFTPSLQVHRYPPAVWGEEEEEDEDVEWDDEGYEGEDRALAEEAARANGELGMEPDDGMSWEDGAAEEARARQLEARAEESRQQELQVQQQQQQQQQQQIQQQQQRQQIEEQQRRQQQQQQQEQQQRSAAAQQSQQGSSLLVRKPDSREVLVDSPVSASPTASGTSHRSLDPAEAVETRKVSATPVIARDDGVAMEQRQQPQAGGVGGPLLPSAIMQRQEDDRKRTREEIEAIESEARKKNKGSPAVQRAPVSSAGKLRKERESTDEESGKDKDRKSKSGLFGGLFGRKKDKGKEKGSSGSISDMGHSDPGRGSEESGRSSNPQYSIQSDVVPPATATPPRQPQQPQQQAMQRAIGPSTPPQDARASGSMSPVSQHAIQLRQRDQQQQALYQQYLNRSPSSPPEAQPSFGLQSASAVMHGSMSFSTASSSSGLGPPTEGRRPRPGSLVLAPSTVDGQGVGVGVPELSVIRVFAGKRLETEATFKTVLLNSSTTSSDLVKQAIQRFRLPAGEDANDYFLTVKQVEGSSAMLRPEEHPLVVFETLVEAAMELPKVKRSSVGSISSITSNLSMHPAIKKLPMNDFTDDSAVKFYLNRKGERGADDGVADDGDDTLMAESVQSDDEQPLSPRPQYLSVSGSGPSVTPERFSSPSFRFALKLIIHPEDLPDDMVFDPSTEAIVFKNTLRDRSQSSAGVSPGISQAHRRKIFVFPKNITVAEVIEIGLERFGILEGVVDGGDEVEDKLSKRRSSSRVRYALNVSVDPNSSKERELSPSSKVIDAYPRPPAYRAVERRFSDSKRRSVDSMQLLGNSDDVQPDDPIFVLRRAVSYRTSSRRLSTALDEIALQHMHRESVSTASMTSDSAAGPGEEPRQRHMSKQELIAAQRAATRANQRAILSAQTNSVRGVDVLLPGNAMIRSSRYEVDDRMRYSYVQPDGETYDISDIVEEEWQGEGAQRRETASQGDLLEGVLSRHKDGLSEKLDRVLNKIKDSRGVARVPVSQATSASTLDSIASEYSDVGPDAAEQSTSRSATPSAAQLNARALASTTSASPQIIADAPRVASPVMVAAVPRTTSPTDPKRPRTNTPTASSSLSSSSSNSKGAAAAPPSHLRQPSIASVMSDLSGYRTAVGSPVASSPSLPSRNASTPKPPKARPVLPKDDFGFSNMMAIIELAGAQNKTPPLTPMDPVDELLFGRTIDLGTLHPHVREIYASTFQQLEEMDTTLDDLLRSAVRA